MLQTGEGLFAGLNRKSYDDFYPKYQFLSLLSKLIDREIPEKEIVLLRYYKGITL